MAGEEEEDMTCVETKNLLCKHIRSNRTYYVDLDDYLPDGVTIVEADADTEDTLLQVETVEVVAEDTVIEANANCDEITLRAGRAILVVLSGGTATEVDDETIVTVNWVQTDGDEDSIDARLFIGGRPNP